MKIEKIRNNHKKEIIIGTILIVVIGGALTYKLTHSKYRMTQSIDLAEGVINYKVPDFKIMAMYQQKDGSTCTDDSCYNEITTMPTGSYVINEEKTYCMTSSGSKVTGKIKTVDGIHGISGLNKGDKCYLYFDKKANSASDVILANIGESNINETTETTPNFSVIADTDEGVFQASDDDGPTYYWRGAVTNNYVKFGGFCWRIIRINGDGTIRMIYDGTTCHANGPTGQTNTDSIAKASIAYNPSYNQSYYVGWTYSSSQRPSTTNNDGTVGTSINAKTQLESWYASNIIGTNATKVADGKYCNDRETESGNASDWLATGSTFYYAGYKRLNTNKTPTFNCSNAGDVYTLKVGLITADEVAFAGGKYYASDGSSNNTSYYLYNGQNYWTMSPYNWSGASAIVFAVYSDGDLGHWYVNNTSPGLRPVINLKADTEFATGGTGIQSNPYTVQ